ncbi:MAG: UDP-N-acetylmuramoyl-L-alanine--D-glutamate ligase [Candidatus Moranbacteria bacterium]|nr:UDP-N-acetylmuramoyl-L-alanine--D-glutamate ligase [Candidatus Moranbacteria bacterium]
MKKSDFKDKRVTVMGIGLHGGGIATVRFFASAGAKVIATDLKTEKELKSSINKLKDLKNVKFILGQHRIEDFENVDLVVKSPAAPWTSKHIQAALKKKIPVEMDSSIFFKLCKLPIIGVTGTKGKTTTATLIAEILKTAGKNVFTAGIGQKPVLNLLDKIGETKKGVVVFELSSWRLSGLGRQGLSPHIAVVTNIYPDHLNYYGTMEKYIADKKYIFANQKSDDYVVLNYDNEVTRELAKSTKSKIIFFSTAEIPGHSMSNWTSNVFVRSGKIIFNENRNETDICDLNDIKLRGGHNIGNVLAAVAAASAFGIAPEKICEAIKNFKGVEHRLEFVREIDKVKYVNDTAATMPDAAIAGINSFSEPIILIAGGADKNLEFNKLAKVISNKAKKLILLKGEATEKIKSELKKINYEKIIDSEFDSMGKAVVRAKNIAGPGDVVLLSPCAASFGLFLNEFDRGDKFREAVAKL